MIDNLVRIVLNKGFGMRKRYRHGLAWGCNKLKGCGYRLTMTRESIVKVLTQSNEHLNVDEIFFEVKKSHPGAGLSSIYRTLDLLVDLGIVHKFKFGEAKSRYELVCEKESSANHHHLICDSCGKIVDYKELLDEEKMVARKMVEKLNSKYGFQITRHIVQYFGICEDCSVN